MTRRIERLFSLAVRSSSFFLFFLAACGGEQKKKLQEPPALSSRTQMVAALPGQCYVFADDGDLFSVVDPTDSDPATNQTDIGTAGVADIEAIAVDPVTNIVYAANAGQLGTLDVGTGAFTATSSTFGSGDGALGTVAFSDIDGLDFNPCTGTLFGTVRRAALSTDPDVLIQIDPATGAHIPDAFGAGIDYVEIPLISSLADIDDIAVCDDGTTCTMYGIANDGGAGDRLVTIDMSTGASTDVGSIGVGDVEGLTCDLGGVLWGSTGGTAQTMFQISTSSGARDASTEITIDSGNDYEAVECYIADLCGDGVVNPGEICDDGNNDNNDGCSSTCEPEPGYICDGASPTVCLLTCGNSVLDAGEACDDGNTTNGDGCSDNCEVDNGYTCVNAPMPSVCTFGGSCGGGGGGGAELVTEGDMESGAGNWNDGGGSGADIDVDSTWDGPGGNDAARLRSNQDLDQTISGLTAGATYTISVDASPRTNGGNPRRCTAAETTQAEFNMANSDLTNWTVTVGGDVFGYTTFTTTFTPTTTSETLFVDWVSGSGCDIILDNISITLPLVAGVDADGDGYDDVFEICTNGTDPEDVDTDGDGYCDDGVAVTVDVGYGTCAVCGDGSPEDPPEGCDDGNNIDGDGCSFDCQPEPGYVCDNTVSPSVCVASCGDGTVDVGEACDDGNTAPGDGCSASCGIEPGWECDGASPTTCNLICSNGVIDAGEACDDGNVIDGDGCDASCAIEAGYECDNTSPPSVCNLICGNSVLDTGEGCDDGNTASGDGCTSDCQVQGGWTCVNSPLPSTCTFTGDVCYAVGDLGDILTEVNVSDTDPATNETTIGTGLGVGDVEAIAFEPLTGTLYAANGGTLGTIDTATGTFTAIGSGFGFGTGSAGTITFNDVDSLSFDPCEGELYAVHRRDPGTDVMFKIDTTTGGYVLGAFGSDDYVELPTVAGFSDIDDLAFCPSSCDLYAVANDGTIGDHLVSVNPATGATTDIGAIGYDDVEGLSCDANGTLYGVTGTSPEFFEIDTGTGAGDATTAGGLDNDFDYEAFGCAIYEVNDCGDGVRQIPELCDDGNTTNGDGCTNCAEDPDADCVEDPVGSQSLCTFPITMARVRNVVRNPNGISFSIHGAYGASMVSVESATAGDEFELIEGGLLNPRLAGPEFVYHVPMALDAEQIRFVERGADGQVVLAQLEVTELLTSTLAFASASVSPANPGAQVWGNDAMADASYSESAGFVAQATEAGVQGVRFTELAELSGVSASEWQRRCDAGQLRIEAGDQVYATLCNTEGALFYLEQADSAFVPGQPIHVSVAAGGESIEAVIADATSLASAMFVRERRIERDEFAAPSAEPEPTSDLYFWSVLAADLESKREMTLPTHDVETRLVGLTLELFSHESELLIAVLANGEVIGQFDIEQVGHHTQELMLSAPLDGVPDITLQIQEGTAFVDAIRFHEQTNVLGAESSFVEHDTSLANVEQPVWDVTEADSPLLLQADSDGLIGLFAGQHIADGTPSWMSVRAARGVDMTNTGASEVLVIAPSSLLPAVARYKEIHLDRAIGHLVLEELFDAYAGGERNPDAIRVAIEHWSKAHGAAPATVVLFGDGHYNYRAVGGDKTNLMPPLLTRTGGQGLYPHDAQLAPASVVARIPVASLEQANAYLDQVAFFVAGNQDYALDLLALSGQGRVAFDKQVSEIVSTFDDEQSAMRLQEGTAHAALPFGTAEQTFYVGHSGVQGIGRSEWLAADDFAGRISPFWVAGTCLVNAFAFPGATESFGESLLRQGGLVIVSPAFPNNTRVNRTGLLDWFQSDEAEVSERVRTSDSLRTYFSILGDPLLRVASANASGEESGANDSALSDEQGSQDVSGGCSIGRVVNGQHSLAWWMLGACLGLGVRRTQRRNRARN